MNPFKLAALFMLQFYFLVNPAEAQISFSNVQDVWNYADKHNIQIKTAEANKTISAISTKQSYSDMMPTVSLNGAFTDNMIIQSTLVPANLFNPAAPAGKYTETTFGRRYIYNGILAAQLDIVNTQDWFNIKAVKLNDEIASLNIARAKSQLYEQLANAYFSYSILSEAEKLSIENVTTATAIYTIANNKFIEGLISEVTVNTALINRQKAKKGLDIAIQNKNLQLNNLKLMLNVADSIIISEKLDADNIATDKSNFAEDPDLQLSYKQMLLSKTQVLQSKAEFAPTLSGVYQYNTQVAADDFLKFNNSNTTPQQYWGLRLSVPLFTGNTRKYQAQKAKADLDIKQKQYENAKLQSKINNKNLVIEYNSSLNAFEKSKTILALYQSNDAHAERRMNEGVISMDDRLKFYSDLINNQNEYLQSMSDYFIQVYRLKIRQTNLIK